MAPNLNEISTRYLRILTSIAEMAEQRELVSDLAHTTIRACVGKMLAEGAVAIDVYNIFGSAIRDIFQEVSPERREYRAVLASAHRHMVYMLELKEHLILLCT